MKPGTIHRIFKLSEFGTSFLSGCEPERFYPELEDMKDKEKIEAFLVQLRKERGARVFPWLITPSAKARALAKFPALPGSAMCGKCETANDDLPMRV
ncbi:MAG: hypothetical protein Q6354_06355 [Candidatus Brocadiales bacterium]|nr:hypothetical protein [Candidatus Brocadiales bacterium]MDO8137246.1 hypothetical protein [Candidatus Brocadiales bacterium]